MVLEIKKIFHLLLSVAFSSTGFIAAVTITVLAAREVSSNPYLIGFPNAVGVGGAVNTERVKPVIPSFNVVGGKVIPTGMPTLIGLNTMGTGI